MEIQKLKLSDIVESPFNPREDFDKVKLAELGADIKARGQQQPIIVRQVGKKLELVDGARRFRAHGLVGLDVIDAIVREMSDLEAEQAQLADNGQPLTALERAKGYSGLCERHGLSVEDLALKIGKSRTTIYATMALLNLQDKPKKALIDGTLPASTAMLLTGLPPSLQVTATQEILTGGVYVGGQPTGMSVKSAQLHLQQKYFLDLRQAPFDVKDAELDPKAGACTTCPKRSDHQRDIFGQGKKEAPLCLAPPCWAVKARLAAEIKAAELGVKLLSETDTEGIFSRYGDVDGAAGYLAKSTIHPTDAKGRKYFELLAPAQLKDFCVLAINPKNELVELLKTQGLQEAIAGAGKYVKREAPKKKVSKDKVAAREKTSANKEKLEAARLKHEAAEALHTRVYPLAIESLRTAAAKKAGDKKLLGMMVQMLWSRTEHAAQRFQLKVGYHLSDAHFRKYFGKLGVPQLFAVLVELVFDDVLETVELNPELSQSSDLFKALGVNLDAIRASLVAADKQAEKAKAMAVGTSNPKIDKVLRKNIAKLEVKNATKASKSAAKKKAA